MKIPVTVLMPVYNGALHIKEAIDSVLAQTFTEFELLIVNDGSTDDTAAIVRQYSDPRIVLLERANGGVSAALNTGLAAARGKYIARFDADDVCYPVRLGVQVNFLESNPDYVMVGSDADYMTEEGEYIHTFRNVGYTDADIRESLAIHCSFIHSSVMYRREVVLSLGGYEVKAHTFEDYFLWTKLIHQGKVCNLPQPLIKVRFNTASVTVDEKDQDKEFQKLKKKALMCGEITDDEGRRINAGVKRLTLRRKQGSYHRLLAKKFLWNNYKPAKARSHIWLSVKVEPLRFTAYFLLLVSLLPQAVINWLYKTKKG